jgi:hypothetical protein
MNTLEEWTAKVCAELRIPADAIDVGTVLDIARDVAHGVARPAAPLTAYLVGVAVGRGMTLPEAARVTQALATTWSSANSEEKHSDS